MLTPTYSITSILTPIYSHHVHANPYLFHPHLFCYDLVELAEDFLSDEALQLVTDKEICLALVNNTLHHIISPHIISYHLLVTDKEICLALVNNASHHLISYHLISSSEESLNYMMMILISSLLHPLDIPNHTCPPPPPLMVEMSTYFRILSF